MDRDWRPFLLLAIVLTLGARAASVVTAQGRAHRPGMLETFDYAAARGDMAAVVIGNPLAGSIMGAVSTALLPTTDPLENLD